MSKKLLMGLVVCILLIPVSAMAAEWDNVKANYNPDNRSIDIVNAYGLGSTIAHLQLIKNTDQALINGRAVFEVALFEDYVEGIVDGTDFVDREGTIQNMIGAWKYEINESYIESTPEYEEVCDGNFANGTENCYWNLTGYDNVTRWRMVWNDYEGQDVPIGIYQFELTSQKPIEKDVDFIPVLFGVELEEFAWWNTTWEKRQEITIEETTGDSFTNYSVYLEIAYDSNMSLNFSDIRFLNNEGTEELSFYFESINDGINATAWVKIPNLIGSLNTTIWMYYNNSAADYGNSSFGDIFPTASWNTNLANGRPCSAQYESGGFPAINACDNVSGWPEWWGGATSDGKSSWFNIPLDGNYLILKVKNYFSSNHNSDTADWGFGLVGGLTTDFGIPQYQSCNGCWSEYDYSYFTSTLYEQIGQNITVDFRNTAGASYGTSQREYQVYGIVRADAEPGTTFGIEEDIGIAFTLFEPEEGHISIENITFKCNILSVQSVDNLTSANITVYNSSDYLIHKQNWSWGAEEGILDVNITFNHSFASEGLYSWFCEASNTLPLEDESDNQTFGIDDTVPSININYPLVEGNSTSVRLNYTVTDTNTNSCWYSLDGGANTSLAGCANTTFNAGTYGSHSIEVFANDTAGSWNSTNRSFVVIEKTAETYSASTIETVTETFTVTIDDTTSLNPTVTLTYDGTEYIAALSSTDGTEKTYSTSLNVGAVSVGNSETRDFNWTVGATLPTGYSGSYVYPTQQQTVSKVFIVPTTDGTTCEGGIASEYTLNFTFKDESSDADVNNMNLTTYYKVWGESAANYVNFTWNEQHAAIASYPVCIFPDDLEIDGTIKLLYGGFGTYAIREFNLQSHELTNSTQSYTLYLLADADATTITVYLTDENEFALNDYLIKVIMVNYGEDNLYLNIESEVTDQEGLALFELDATKYYKFEVWKDGVLLYALEPPFIIKDSDLYITLAGSDTSTIGVMLGFNDVSSQLNWNNATGNITGTWSDDGTIITGACLDITNINSTDFGTVIYSVCAENTSGSLSYNVVNDTNIHLMANLRGHATADGNYYSLDQLELDTRQNYIIFGDEGLFWAGIIGIGTLIVMSLFNPAVAIVGSIFGLIIFGLVLNMFYISWLALAGLVFVALLIATRLKS